MTGVPIPLYGKWRVIYSTLSMSLQWSTTCYCPATRASLLSFSGRCSFFIPTHQVQTSLSDALAYLKHAKEDCVILVSMPAKPRYSPQPWRGRYLTLLPISGDPDIDRSPLGSFAAATLPVASREGCGGDMPVCIKTATLLWLIEATQDGVDSGVCLLQGPSMEEHSFCGVQL